MDEYQFSGSNGGETFEEGAETMETEEGAGVTGPDETQEILRSNSLKLKSFLFTFSFRTCLVKFGSPDFIMEPEIFTQLKKYFQAGGNPEQVLFWVLEVCSKDILFSGDRSALQQLHRCGSDG